MWLRLPQTVWTDLFLLVERLTEGDRRQRLKNIGVPLTPKRAVRIVAKHATWLLISLATGGTLIFYFTDAPDLLRDLAAGNFSANALTWIAVFTGTTYGLASGGLHRQLSRLSRRAADLREEGRRVAPAG